MNKVVVVEEKPVNQSAFTNLTGLLGDAVSNTKLTLASLWQRAMESARLPHLLRGSHGHTFENQAMCAMEMVSFLNGDEYKTDTPPCTNRMLATCVQKINDYLYDDERQQLKPFLPRLLGANTNDPLIFSRMAGLVHQISHSIEFSLNLAVYTDRPAAINKILDLLNQCFSLFPDKEEVDPKVFERIEQLAGIARQT